MKIVFMKRKNIHLGDQLVTELTVLEWKPLFSIKLFHFHPSSGVQDRFHTHAFKAVSFLLSGNYMEEIIRDGKIIKLPRNRKRVLYIPKDEFHRIGHSGGCKTLLITGPWGDTFRELTQFALHPVFWKETICGEHRKVLKQGRIFKLEE